MSRVLILIYCLHRAQARYVQSAVDVIMQDSQNQERRICVGRFKYQGPSFRMRASWVLVLAAHVQRMSASMRSACALHFQTLLKVAQEALIFCKFQSVCYRLIIIIIKCFNWKPMGRPSRFSRTTQSVGARANAIIVTRTPSHMM